MAWPGIQSGGGDVGTVSRRGERRPRRVAARGDSAGL